MSDAPQHEPPWVDSAIFRLLRTGVIVSMVVVFTGLVVSFVRHPQYIGSAGELGRLTDSHAVYPHSLAEVAGLLRDGRGRGIVMLGLLLLVATPVARVAFSIVAFAVERDRLYVAITATVLALLVLSFAIGAAG